MRHFELILLNLTYKKMKSIYILLISFAFMVNILYGQNIQITKIGNYQINGKFTDYIGNKECIIKWKYEGIDLPSEKNIKIEYIKSIDIEKNTWMPVGIINLETGEHKFTAPKSLSEYVYKISIDTLNDSKTLLITLPLDVGESYDKLRWKDYKISYAESKNSIKRIYEEERIRIDQLPRTDPDLQKLRTANQTRYSSQLDDLDKEYKGEFAQYINFLKTETTLIPPLNTEESKLFLEDNLVKNYDIVNSLNYLIGEKSISAIKSDIAKAYLGPVEFFFTNINSTENSTTKDSIGNELIDSVNLQKGSVIRMISGGNTFNILALYPLLRFNFNDKLNLLFLSKLNLGLDTKGLVNEINGASMSLQIDGFFNLELSPEFQIYGKATFAGIFSDSKFVNYYLRNLPDRPKISNLYNLLIGVKIGSVLQIGYSISGGSPFDNNDAMPKKNFNLSITKPK